MDPYLEDPAFWPDFHATFVNYWREEVAAQLPDHYEARLDEQVNLVQIPPEKTKRVRPDVSVTRDAGAGSARGPSAVSTLEPTTVPLLIEEETRQTYIEILRRPDRILVAVLELLSPANKELPGRGQYLEKRNAVLRQEVHLVELDLLFGGERIPLDAPYPSGDYYALVARFDRRWECDVYAWSVRDRLPTIPIPLLPEDGEVGVDLAAVFATTYERGRYARSLSYGGAAPISAKAETAAWIEQQVK
jgi:hypothetical protein